MSYEAWRISFQSAEQAARQAYAAAQAYRVALAWELYCCDTAGGMDVRDYWTELSAAVQARYLQKADEAMHANASACG